MPSFVTWGIQEPAIPNNVVGELQGFLEFGLVYPHQLSMYEVRFHYVSTDIDHECLVLVMPGVEEFG